MNPTEADKGEIFYHFADRVIKALQTSEDKYTDIVFNEIEIRVDRRSFVDDICHIYDLKSAFRHLQTLK